jgi:hypothetical protein
MSINALLRPGAKVARKCSPLRHGSPRQRNNQASASGYGAVRPAPSEPSRLLQQPDLLEIADQSRCRELVSAVSILPFRSRAKCDWAASCSALLKLTFRQRACALSGHPASRTTRPSSGDWSKAGRTDRITPPVPPSKSSISSEPFGEIGPKFPRKCAENPAAPAIACIDAAIALAEFLSHYPINQAKAGASKGSVELRGIGPKSQSAGKPCEANSCV